MRIGIFGGTFDPVHNAHLIVALTARDALGLDLVRFVVAGEPRLRPPARASAADRFAMVELAIAGIEGFVTDRSEVDRPGPTRTVETLRALRAFSPEDELVLLLGRDAALRFGEWHEPDEIRRLARIAVCGLHCTPKRKSQNGTAWKKRSDSKKSDMTIPTVVRTERVEQAISSTMTMRSTRLRARMAGATRRCDQPSPRVASASTATARAAKLIDFRLL